jgi:hypothetical protein
MGAVGNDAVSWEAAVSKGIGPLVFALATPGDLNSRGWLVSVLLPPLVQFDDGSRWNPARDAAAAIGAANHELDTLDAVAALGTDIEDRWQRYLFALRGY